MRISDWSSDVCSSDLPGRSGRRRRRDRAAARRRRREARLMRTRGLTWDHPRGYNALAAAAATSADCELDWDKQPLEGFEAHPIADLCARYDLVVLDHPHVGEAVAAGCLQPLEAHFGADAIAELGAERLGPSLASYRYENGRASSRESVCQNV